MSNKNLLRSELERSQNLKATPDYFQEKQELIGTLKESNYEKDIDLAEEKRSQHKTKQKLLLELSGKEGIDDEFVDRFRQALYPGYVPSHKQYDKSTEQVEESGMSEELIQQAINRNTYNTKYI